MTGIVIRLVKPQTSPASMMVNWSKKSLLDTIVWVQSSCAAGSSARSNHKASKLYQLKLVLYIAGHPRPPHPIVWNFKARSDSEIDQRTTPNLELLKAVLYLKTQARNQRIAKFASRKLSLKVCRILPSCLPLRKTTYWYAPPLIPECIFRSNSIRLGIVTPSFRERLE